MALTFLYLIVIVAISIILLSVFCLEIPAFIILAANTVVTEPLVAIAGIIMIVITATYLIAVITSVIKNYSFQLPLILGEINGFLINSSFYLKQISEKDFLKLGVQLRAIITVVTIAAAIITIITATPIAA